MMCEPVRGRHAESWKQWHLKCFFMTVIYLHKLVIYQGCISVKCETAELDPRAFHGPRGVRLDWSDPVGPSALWLSPSAIITTNASLINELRLKVQQLWIWMNAEILLMIMKQAFFFHRNSVPAAILFKDLWHMRVINGMLSEHYH